MISLLQLILCAILNLAAAIIDLLIAAVNLALAGIGALVQAGLDALPPMWETPDLPDVELLRFINWFLPLGPMLAATTIALAAVLAWIVFRVTVLKWWWGGEV